MNQSTNRYCQPILFNEIIHISKHNNKNASINSDKALIRVGNNIATLASLYDKKQTTESNKTTVNKQTLSNQPNSINTKVNKDLIDSFNIKDDYYTSIL